MSNQQQANGKKLQWQRSENTFALPAKETPDFHFQEFGEENFMSDETQGLLTGKPVEKSASTSTADDIWGKLEDVQRSAGEMLKKLMANKIVIAVGIIVMVLIFFAVKASWQFLFGGSEPNFGMVQGGMGADSFVQMIEEEKVEVEEEKVDLYERNNGRHYRTGEDKVWFVKKGTINKGAILSLYQELTTEYKVRTERHVEQILKVDDSDLSYSYTYKQKGSDVLVCVLYTDSSTDSKIGWIDLKYVKKQMIDMKSVEMKVNVLKTKIVPLREAKNASFSNDDKKKSAELVYELAVAEYVDAKAMMKEVHEAEAAVARATRECISAKEKRDEAMDSATREYISLNLLKVLKDDDEMHCQRYPLQNMESYNQLVAASAMILMAEKNLEKMTAERDMKLQMFDDWIRDQESN